MMYLSSLSYGITRWNLDRICFVSKYPFQYWLIFVCQIKIHSGVLKSSRDCQSFRFRVCSGFLSVCNHQFLVLFSGFGAGIILVLYFVFIIIISHCNLRKSVFINSVLKSKILVYIPYSSIFIIYIYEMMTWLLFMCYPWRTWLVQIAKKKWTIFFSSTLFLLLKYVFSMLFAEPFFKWLIYFFLKAFHHCKD